MSQLTLPTVLINFRAWKKIVAEVAYWVSYGEQQQNGLPYEATFYPLVSLQLRESPLMGPFTPITLPNVREILLDSVFFPARQLTQYSVTSAQFIDNTQLKLTEDFQQTFKLALQRRAQLLFLGPGHSHPFAVNHTWPSYTDIQGHMLPYRRQNETLLGIKFSLALIVVRRNLQQYQVANINAELNNPLFNNKLFVDQKHFPTAHAVPHYLSDPTAWQVCAFAIDEANKVQPLSALIVPHKHHQMQLARQKPFFQTRQGRQWEKQQLTRLGSKLLEHARWPGGWTTFLIQQTPTVAQLLSFPPSFPQTAPVQQIIQLSTRQVSPCLPLTTTLPTNSYPPNIPFPFSSLSSRYQNYQLEATVVA